MDAVLRCAMLCFLGQLGSGEEKAKRKMREGTWWSRCSSGKRETCFTYPCYFGINNSGSMREAFRRVGVFDMDMVFCWI
ncbi:hypothetical protein B0J11DRAFT_286868 [Dendryphion nanum]|uniref:Secreted protein n=1 Tax=Dendryphion nanum TaxID=256645 RepID=A0A9P9INH8_9PLEO|nr:hypothetical protein B0J11DRAFT_286868 [Dendryphion nanum]